MRIEHDKEADALYVHLSDGEYDHGDDLDPERRVDFSADGQCIGIELLNVSHGIDVRGLPSEVALVPELQRLGLKVLSARR